MEGHKASIVVWFLAVPVAHSLSLGLWGDQIRTEPLASPWKKIAPCAKVFSIGRKQVVVTHTPTSGEAVDVSIGDICLSALRSQNDGSEVIFAPSKANSTVEQTELTEDPASFLYRPCEI